MTVLDSLEFRISLSLSTKESFERQICESEANLAYMESSKQDRVYIVRKRGEGRERKERRM